MATMSDTELLYAMRVNRISVTWDKMTDRCRAYTKEVDSDWHENVQDAVEQCILKQETYYEPPKRNSPARI